MTQFIQLRRGADYITLGQLLKLTGLIGSGGETKSFLAQAEVRVNDEREQRRGRKLHAGDCVHVNGRSFQIADS
ncbi:MAG: RNA-binding S4 domain-containing protein [Sporolactobacillus sp.]